MMIFSNILTSDVRRNKDVPNDSDDMYMDGAHLFLVFRDPAVSSCLWEGLKTRVDFLGSF